MIADSDAELRQQLSSRLLEIDVFCDGVATAADAIEKLNATRYAVVVVDVGLPHEGIEPVIARAGRLTPRPIVLVLAAKPEAARGLDVETVQIVLRRPVDVPQLVELIRSCLRSSRTARPADSDGVRNQPIS